MPSRRDALRLLGSAAAATAGCLTRDGTTPTPSATPTRTGPPTDQTPTGSPRQQTPDTTTPEDWPPADWSPAWSHDVPGTHALSAQPVGSDLLVLSHRESGPGFAQRFDPGTRTVAWERELPGEVAADAFVPDYDTTGSWGATLTGDLALVVTQSPNERTWSRLSALDLATGEVRWSLRRDRRVTVEALAGGRCYLASREFEERTTDEHFGETDTPTPEPLAATLLTIDLADGSVAWSRDFRGMGAVTATDDGVVVGEMNVLRGFGSGGRQAWTVTADSRLKVAHATGEAVFGVARPDWDRSQVLAVGPGGTERWRKWFPTSHAVGVGDRLYVGGDVVAALSPSGVAWRRRLATGAFLPAPDEGRIYVRTGVRANRVTALETADGSVAWTFAPAIANAWPTAAGNGWLVAGGIGESGTPLYRVDAESGEATGRFRGGDPLDATVHEGTAFASLGSHGSGGANLAALPLQG